MSKALVWHLGSIKELANCGLHFRGFKAANTVRCALKSEKQQISYKERTQKLKSKMQSPSKVFQTQDETNSSWVTWLDVKSCQVK